MLVGVVTEEVATGLVVSQVMLDVQVEELTEIVQLEAEIVPLIVSGSQYLPFHELPVAQVAFAVA